MEERLVLTSRREPDDIDRLGMFDQSREVCDLPVLAVWVQLPELIVDG